MDIFELPELDALPVLTGASLVTQNELSNGPFGHVSHWIEYVDGRVAAMDLGRRRDSQQFWHAIRSGDPQPHTARSAATAEDLGELIAQSENLGRIIQRAFAGGGQPQAPARSLKQWLPNGELQLLDLAADRLRCHKQRTRCLRNRASARRFSEIP